MIKIITSLLLVLLTGPIKYEYSVKLPVIISSNAICVGEFQEDLTINYSNGSVYIEGNITVSEDSYYIILCRDAFRIDFPNIASEPNKGQLFWLIDSHLMLVGPFDEGEEIVIK